MTTHIIPRSLALVAGVGLLGAAAHAVIAISGGYADPHALMIVAATVAVISGSIAIAHASWKWTAVILLGLLCGELYALTQTAERIIAHRASVEAPARAAAETRKTALERVAKAEAAKAQADTAAIEKAAEKACAKNCRALLETAKTDAKVELDAARAAVEALPPATEAAPLAARLGIDGATLDLAVAILGSLAANGLGGCLIAFGAHAPATVRNSRRVAVAETVAPRIRVETEEERATRMLATMGNRATVARPATVSPSETVADQADLYTVSDADAATVLKFVRPDPVPGNPGNGRNGRRVSTKAKAEAEIIELVGRGPIPSQDDLANRWGVHKGTVSKWLTDWEARGIVRRHAEGRCKAVRSA